MFIHDSVIEKDVTDGTGKHADVPLLLPRSHILQGGQQVKVVLQSGVPKKVLFPISLFFSLETLHKYIMLSPIKM